MTNRAKRIGDPISVDYIADERKHQIEVQFCCGTFTDFIRFEFRSEADASHAFQMWQELISVAEQFDAE